MQEILGDLTAEEQRLLTRCEHRIEAGLHTFYNVGTALATIRDRKLYKKKYATFGEYCQERWHFGVRQAYRFMEAADICKNVEATGIVPANERQIRSLKKIPTEKQAEVWQQAVTVAGGIENLTSAQTDVAVRRHLHLPVSEISGARCIVCNYCFPDRHHLKSQSSGGRNFSQILLCPNHHRYATILQNKIRKKISRQEIEEFAKRYFDAGFNAKLLKKLLDHSFQLESDLSDSYNVFTSQFMEDLETNNLVQNPQNVSHDTQTTSDLTPGKWTG